MHGLFMRIVSLFEGRSFGNAQQLQDL